MAELVPAATGGRAGGDVGEALQRIVAEDDGPSLSRYLEMQAARASRCASS